MVTRTHMQGKSQCMSSQRYTILGSAQPCAEDKTAQINLNNTVKQGRHSNQQISSSRIVPSNEVYNLSLLYYLTLIIHQNPLNN